MNHSKAVVTASMAALERSPDPEKADHCHILIQFSTRKTHTREAWLKLLGVEALNMQAVSTKQSLENVILYLQKQASLENGTLLIRGNFYWKSEEISHDPLISQFSVAKRTRAGAAIFLERMIEERVTMGDLSGGYAQSLFFRGDSISHYLLINTSL